MAHYGRSPEESALRGEEDPYLSDLQRVRSDIPAPVMMPRAREAAERAGRMRPAAYRVSPEGSLGSGRPAVELVTFYDNRSPYPEWSDLFRGGHEVSPGLVASLDVGRRTMLKFTKRF